MSAAVGRDSQSVRDLLMGLLPSLRSPFTGKAPMIGQRPPTKSAGSNQALHVDDAARSAAQPLEDRFMPPAVAAPLELAGSVERRIQLRTHGRVRDLRVELAE